jgi:hypothetical protein
MNAIPHVTIRPVLRPTFDNTCLADYSKWVLANTETLARYWHDQGIALGLTSEDDDEFTFWLRVQHDIEVASRKRSAAHGKDSL